MKELIIPTAREIHLKLHVPDTKGYLPYDCISIRKAKLETKKSSETALGWSTAKASL